MADDRKGSAPCQAPALAPPPQGLVSGVGIATVLWFSLWFSLVTLAVLWTWESPTKPSQKLPLNPIFDERLSAARPFIVREDKQKIVPYRDI